MQKFILFILLSALVFETSFPQTSVNNAYKKGEKLKYRIHYGFLTGGYAEIEVKEQSFMINSKPCHQLVIWGYTVGITDWVYKVKDRYESFVDEKSLLPLKHIRDVSESSYKRHDEVIFDYEKDSIRSKLHGLFHLNEETHDIVSAFFYARCNRFEHAKKGDTLIVQTFFDDKIFPFGMIYLGKETVSTDAGDFRCLKIRPLVQTGRVFKSKDDMTFWITDDKNHIPVLIKTELLVGSLKVNLTEYSGIKNELAKIDD